MGDTRKARKDETHADEEEEKEKEDQERRTTTTTKETDQGMHCKLLLLSRHNATINVRHSNLYVLSFFFFSFLMCCLF